MLVIGLTAGIGSGKSVVGNWFREIDIPVIDADAIVHNLYSSESNVTKRIVQVMGEEILESDGSIDRKKLGEIVFNDPDKLDHLNKIVHPEVRIEIDRKLREFRRQNSEIVVMEVPLLFESKMDNLAEKIIVVTIPKERQIERIMERDKISREEAEKIISFQMTNEEREEKADYIIDNSQSMFSTKQQFEKILKQIKEKI